MHSAPPLARAVVCQPFCAQREQPLRRRVETQARVVQMLHVVRAQREIPNRLESSHCGAA